MVGGVNIEVRVGFGGMRIKIEVVKIAFVVGCDIAIIVGVEAYPLVRLQ